MSIEQTKQDDVATLAYRLWERAGQPTGRDIEFWLQAEVQVRDQITNRSPSSENAARIPALPAKGASRAAVGRAQDAGREKRQPVQHALNKGGVRSRQGLRH